MTRGKVKMARKMMTQKEIKNHTPIFGSDAWKERRVSIKKKVKRQQLRSHKRALKRKGIK